MRQWLVGGAVIEAAGELLLVCNQRRNGRRDWSPPGGVIDDGESLIEGLTREVREETGLTVSDWRGPVYGITAEAPDLGWRLRVEAHEAVSYVGELAVDDPDGIVVDAAFMDAATSRRHLELCPPWVREPLAEFLDERWVASREFRFLIEGTDLASLAVTRL